MLTYVTPVPNPGILIGRVDLLTDIHTMLQSARPVVLLHGIGGIGKTTAACRYAYHPDFAPTYEVIAHVEVVTSLADAFLSERLVQYLGVGEQVEQTLRQANPAGAFEAVALALCRRTDRWLIIIDNANDPGEILRILPQLAAPHLALLISSRARPDDVPRIQVEELPPEEAAELFARHYEQPLPPLGQPDRAALDEALAQVQRHTLLVEMLGKISREAGHSLTDLLGFLQALGLRHPELQLEVGTGQSGQTHRLHEDTLQHYVRHLYREIRDLDESDQELLRWLAVLPPRTHDLAAVARLFGVTEDERPALRQRLNRLDRRGIPLLEGKGYRMHILFREVAIEELQPFTVDNCATVLASVEGEIEFDNDLSRLTERREWLPYFDKLDLHLLPNDHLKISRIQNEAALWYLAFGHYELAKTLLQKSLASAIKHFGDSHAEVASRQANLAMVLHDLNTLPEARDLLRASLAFVVKNLDQDHPSISVRQSNLALILQDLGELEEARDLLRTALASDLKNLSPGHPSVAIRQSNLALVLSDLDQLTEACDLLRAALASALKNFVYDHPRVAGCQSNLATVLVKLNEFGEAKDLLCASLTSDIKNFGFDHPNVAIDQFNLAFTLWNLGFHDEATILWQQAYAIWLKVFGPEHPHTIDAATALRIRGFEPGSN